MRPAVDNKGRSSVSLPAGHIGTIGTIRTITKTEFESGNTSLFQSQACMNSFRGHHLKIKSIPECEEVNPVLQKGKVVKFQIIWSFRKAKYRAAYDF